MSPAIRSSKRRGPNSSRTCNSSNWCPVSPFPPELFKKWSQCLSFEKNEGFNAGRAHEGTGHTQMTFVVAHNLSKALAP